MLLLSKTKGVGGVIKGAPEDFIVEEITKAGTTLRVDKRYTSQEAGMASSDSGRFAVFVMQKRNWNTAQAAKTVANMCGRGMRSVGFAGTKDRTSVSTQLCSLFGADLGRLLSMHIKDVSINGAWSSDNGIELGDLLGNSFTVSVRKSSADKGAIGGILKELGGVFPNYFGEQRFGFRGNNAEMGLAIIRGDFEEAVMSFLTDITNEADSASIEARRMLASEMDFGRALGYFPRHLKYERVLLEYLSRFPDNYANALRRLPRQLTLMFVHSVESWLFNRIVEKRVGLVEKGPLAGDLFCWPDSYGFPDLSRIGRAGADTVPEGGFTVGRIIGYDTKDLSVDEAGLLEELGIAAESFKIKGMPELNCRGAYRVIFAPYVDFSCQVEGDCAVMSFSLPAGSYATVFLNEFLHE